MDFPRSFMENFYLSLPIIYFDSKIPKNLSEYYNIRENYFWTKISVSGDNKTNSSFEIGKVINKKLTSLGVTKDEPIIIKVKNAKIVGCNMPSNSNCLRGISLRAQSKNIIFEKIE